MSTDYDLLPSGVDNDYTSQHVWINIKHTDLYSTYQRYAEMNVEDVVAFFVWIQLFTYLFVIL